MSVVVNYGSCGLDDNTNEKWFVVILVKCLRVIQRRDVNEDHCFHVKRRIKRNPKDNQLIVMVSVDTQL